MSDTGSLQRLHRVQQLDLNLDQLRAEESNIPDALRDARAQQTEINNSLEDTEITLEGVEKQLRQAEMDLAGTRDQIQRAKEELDKNAFDARAQSQYGSRIQMLGERADEMEEDLGPLRERQQELAAKASQLRQAHRDLRPTLDALETEDEQRVQGLRDQGQADREERAQLVENLDSRTVKEYDLIRKAKKGLGVVEIKGGRCSGCNVVLPVNVQQKAALGQLPPVKCPSCGRFLIRLDLA
ncbi:MULTISPECIES: zinc ribbon domain-containing protein [Deinococcus]|jgi:predicted  nucleic acid-binding Zn-ribbon protein|uniref:DNA-binding protein n=2 Tax=Deinococcus TaxID=1298 RepID=A0A221STG8_9DEIO|nr:MULTISPECIES: zinc ribbon domain-containing protein [Deinococcus]ASN79934.1 DNA-binding protein [Deinococcus ficus]MDP9765794.1 putative nucleic acid-binding Zn-ribbon protein [Deinococcus enclensis]GHF80952.1 DNA-binding protein [Deinococcus ficus]